MQIPSTRVSFKLSWSALAIVVAALILGTLLAISTVRNLAREQKIMKSFLLDEGLVLIRSFQAGARTTMMHHMMNTSSPLETLVTETAKTDRIAYIHVVTEDGVVLATAGKLPPRDSHPESSRVLAAEGPVTTIINLADSGSPIFEVATEFHMVDGDQSGNSMASIMFRRRQQWMQAQFGENLNKRKVIYIGLYTDEFIQAQEQDLRHTLFMGGLLLLLGSAGFYFLFLYQGARITRATLDTMRLYTRSVIESMPDGLMTLDCGQRIVSVNARAARLTGFPAGKLSGIPVDRVFANWPGEQICTKQGVVALEYEIQRTDNLSIPVRLSSSPLKDQEGNRLGTVVIIRDIRDLRAMEEQLERSRRLAALGRMAAGIAHEIRNPLGTLRGFAQYFGNQATDKNSLEYAQLMVDEVDRLNAAISALLQFSRPRDPEFQKLSPARVLEKTARLLEHDFKAGNIHFSMKIQCTGTVVADEDLLLQVVLNLLKNSLHATPAGGHISLFCSEEKDTIRITVSDSGKGMSGEEQEKMFDPFFTTRRAGTGLGLAVSHQIVEQHHGHFEVVSAPGRGTEITIVLPVTQKKQTGNG
ncbi:two-component system sensor histidine kinase NtrB [Desulfolithobacter sp.]